MTEVCRTGYRRPSQPSADAGVHISDAGKDAIHLMMGVQTAFLQEMVFAGYVDI